jgi:hypothetical protein
MSAQKPIRSYKRRTTNAVGRVDVLAMSAIDLLVAKYMPSLAPVYTQARPGVQAEVMKYLGPRKAHMRSLRDIVRNLAIIRAQKQQTGNPFMQGGQPS